jgi:ADP-ribose pyrophosphatase YjhB (NUDIX family)
MVEPRAVGPDEVVAVPRVPVSAGALIYDEHGRLLILKPTYKSGWTIPGGQLEETGESPWEGCRRETFEECGLRIERGRLACVDFRRPRERGPGGVRFLFDCGRLGRDELAHVRLEPAEISEHRFVALEEAATLLRGPVRRRVAAAVASEHCVYLEDGRPVSEVADTDA